MDYTKTLQALRKLKVQTGSLACLGCGHEHNCGVHGCAIIREAVAQLTERLARDGYTVCSGPRVTGDGYYESCVLDPEGNQVEIVA